MNQAPSIDTIDIVINNISNFAKQQEISSKSHINLLLTIVAINLEKLKQLIESQKHTETIIAYKKSITRAFNTDVLIIIEKKINEHLEICHVKKLPMKKKIDNFFNNHKKIPNFQDLEKIINGLRIIRNAYAHAIPELRSDEDKNLIDEIKTKKLIPNIRLNNKKIEFKNNLQYFITTIKLVDQFLSEVDKLSDE